MPVRIAPQLAAPVLYRPHPNAEPMAAIITHVWAGVVDRVNLTVFDCLGKSSGRSQVDRDSGRGGWSWPDWSAQHLAELVCAMEDEREGAKPCPACGSGKAGCDCE